MVATAVTQDDLTLLAPSHLTVIFEYAVGPDGSPRDIKVIRCEDSATRQAVKNALTEKQKQIGASIIAHPRRPLAKISRQKAV